MKFIASAVSLLASLSSCNAETPLLRAAISTDESPAIVDLSQDIPRDEAAISSSPGAKAVQEAAAENPFLLNVMVIENGSIVSSYHRDDVDPNETHFVFSVTKGWESLLFGMLVDDGLLSLDTTLGEIFTDDDAWADVTDGTTDFRKGVTIEELLTMTSGLISPAAVVFEGSLEEALSYPEIGAKGEWSYLMVSMIPSYIVKERTGMTPRQYLDKNVMGKLGIGEDEYRWDQNAEGIELGFTGMHLTPMQMAKFGQLYLQGGRTNPTNNERLISEEWIDASFTHHSTTDFSDFPHTPPQDAEGQPYGYWFGGFEYPSSTVYCALGDSDYGQFICVDRDLGRVAIAQREDFMERSMTQTLLGLIFDNTLSFRAPNGGLSGISSTVM